MNTRIVASTLEGDFMLTKRAVPHVLLILLLAVTVTGCQVVGGIFKAGFWTGIFLVALVAIGLTFMVVKMKS
jgi:hypothetical protein